MITLLKFAYTLHQTRRLARSFLVAVVVVVQAGCSTPPQSPWTLQASPPAAADCSLLLQRLAQRIKASGGSDPLAYPIAAYPYLRVDRLLASFSTQLDSEARQQAWYQQLYRLGQTARQVELDNLAPPLTVAAREQIERCIEQQAFQDRQAENFFPQLTTSAQVPDLYSGWQRGLGLFPLTRQIVLHLIAKHQQRWRQDFNSPALLQGPSQRYLPPASEPLNPEQIADWLELARGQSPLGIPELDAEQQRALFRYFAPVWQVFTRSPADLIGRPYWRDGTPGIDSNDPITYWLPSYTRFNGQTLLQLNYLVWFPERPSQRPLDLFAGLLDGLLWRVTLDSEGRVLLYDSIHPCGCYHQIFPVSERLAVKPLPANLEQPLILTGVAPGRSQGRVLLQLTPSDHYLQGIAVTDKQLSGAVAIETSISSYRLGNYHQLRSLATASGRRNLFDPDGLVGASARLERFLLWPMGVDSPGAMRVWGAHAISFANRRYFDDPYLFEQFFEQTAD